MSFFSFLKSKSFFNHLLLSLLFVGLLIFITFKWVGCATNHGETINVPDFSGLKITELDDFIKDKNLRYEIIDSIFDVKMPKGVVIRQDPEPNETVKDNRIIYLYVTSVLPPRLEMPKLVDRSLRQATAMIESYGLKLGNTRFIPDQCANCVLEQLIKGKTVQPGTMIEKGTVIDLVAGKGLGSETVTVPYFIGLTRAQVLAKLSESSLNEGAVNYDNPRDSLIARVYRQYPGYSSQSKVNIGSSIDFFYTSDVNKIPLQVDTTGNK